MWLGQDDVDVLTGRADGDPAEALGGNVVADLEAERVPVGDETGVDLGRPEPPAAGGAVGYQMFFNNERTQLVLEIGGREPTTSHQKGAIGFGSRLQFALWDRYRLQFDGFGSDMEGGITGAGLRSEFSVQV